MQIAHVEVWWRCRRCRTSQLISAQVTRTERDGAVTIKAPAPSCVNCAEQEAERQERRRSRRREFSTMSPDYLRGSVDVPRAVLVEFQNFLIRFGKETITDNELREKVRWFESLLKKDGEADDS